MVFICPDVYQTCIKTVFCTFKLCMPMHLHIGRAPRYMADSVQSIEECSRRLGLRSADTADYVKHRLQSKFGERCFSYAGWSGCLAGTHYITASGSSRTLADLNSFSSLIYFVFLFDILLAPLDNL